MLSLEFDRNGDGHSIPVLFQETNRFESLHCNKMLDVAAKRICWLKNEYEVVSKAEDIEGVNEFNIQSLIRRSIQERELNFCSQKTHEMRKDSPTIFSTFACK